MIDYAPKDCWVTVYYTGSSPESEYLPTYPDEVSDSQSAIWSSTQIVGRSSPLVAYTGTDARKINFSMTLHREMIGKDNIDKINHILVILKKALYPEYKDTGLIPPKIRVVLGNLAVDGILESLSFNWKKPIVEGFYSVCDVSVSITGYQSGIKSASNISSPYDPDKVKNILIPTKEW